MGLLPDDYYANTLKENNTPSPLQPSNNEAVPSSVPAEPQAEPTAQPVPADPFPQRTVKDQTSQFGGEVGSPEYLNYEKNRSTLSRLPREAASAVGIELPDQQSWDKMSSMEHAEQITAASLVAVGKAVLGFPKAIADTVAGGANTVYEGWQKATKGTPFATPEPNPSPLATVPSYFKTWDDARKSGMGKLASSVMVGGRISQDGMIIADVASAIKNSFAPKAQTLAEGTALKTIEPVQTMLKQEQDKLSLRKGTDTSSEYHPMTKTDAKKFGGNTGNTFIKFTPAVADGSKVELSIVKVNNPIDNFLGKIFKNEDVTEGKFGKEKKIYSQIIDADPSLNVESKAGDIKDVTVPSAPMKGFADKPVTADHIANLDAIGRINELDPGLQSGVVKALTGKDVVGDLTQAEYTNVAQTMAKLGKSSEYAPEALGFGNWVKNYFSPTRYWTRDVQEATGIPVHDAHMQLETGSRLAKVSEQTQLGNLYSDPIIEKYSSSNFADERALVKSYMEGDTGAITDNPSLSPETKADLVHAAGVFDTYMKGVATDVGMDPQAFLENYAPHVQERGGKFQLYKEPGNIPSGSDAFFREKRSGGLYTQINDMWALADIYTRSAYKAKYIGPALDKMNEFKNSLPSGVRDRLASYVQEKLGYGGGLEKVMDSVAGTLNKKLGWNLPEDTARVMTNQALNTMYSSAMSQPSTWLRNAFQYPTMGFAYWGSKFMGDALVKAYSKEGMAEFLKSGFSVDLGVPFGEEISKNSGTMGKVNNAYRDFTQSILKPNSWIENRNRAPMYFQTKMIFDDAISKFNSGKLTWGQAEHAMGLDTLNPIDANLVRSDLTSGDLKGAFEKLAQNAIDDTQFPYRKGESWRLSYGMAGKISTPFMQWPVEYIHTLGKWAGTGQWDKLARWYGSTSLIARTFTSQYNTDFGKSLGITPVTNVNLNPPPLNVIQNGLGLIYNHLNDNEQAYEKNGEELFKTLKLTVPGGAEGANILKFYNAYKRGPNEDGEYAVPDAGGRPNYYSFKDLFWQALGMPVVSKVANQDLQSDISKSKFEYSQAHKKVVELYQDGMSSINNGQSSGKDSIDQANQLISEWAKKGLDISPTDSDFNKFYIPANVQTWNALPDALKAKFAPRVFKSKQNVVQ